MISAIQEEQMRECLLGYLEELRPQSPVEEAMILFVARMDWLLQTAPYKLNRREEKMVIDNMKVMLDRLFRFRDTNPPPRRPAAGGKVVEMPKHGKNARAVSDLPAQDMHEEKPRERSGPAGYYRIHAIDLRRDAA